MKIDKQKLNQIAESMLHDSKRGDAAVQALMVELSRHYSLRAIGRKLGIKSSGYVSDVLSGRRRLSQKYLPSLMDAFNLPAVAETILKSLLKLDDALGDDNFDEVKVLNQEISRQRRLLNVKYFEADQINESVFLHVIFLGSCRFFQRVLIGHH